MVRDIFVKTRLPDINRWVNRKLNRASLRALKKGTHPQMWRPNFGPVGWFGDSVVLECKLNKSLIGALGLGYLDEQFFTMIFYNDVIVPLVNYLHDKIERWVPRDTGKLRMVLHRSLSNDGASNIYSFPFYVVLNTKGLIYSKPVNNMPTSWLAHPHPTKSYPRSMYLYDPEAKKGWYNLLLVNGRNKAKKLFFQFLKNNWHILPSSISYLLNTKNNYNAFKKFFSVRFK